MTERPKLIRVTTVPVSLNILLKGQFKFMSEHGFEVIAVSSAGPELTELSEREKIQTRTVEMSRKITPVRDLISLIRMYRLFKTEKPQIVHSHTPKAGVISMLAARLAGVPVRLHTVAGLPLMESKGLRKKLLSMVERLTYCCATQVFPNSKGLYEYITHHHFASPNKLKIISNGSSNGIDPGFFFPETVSRKSRKELRDKLNISQNDFVFVFVGRLVGDKGVNELVSAFKRLSTKTGLNKTPKLLLVGNYETELDPLKPETLKEIETNPNIIYAGYQKDVRPWFGISDCLAFPSYREGFPNVILQAAAMGLPSVVSDICGCNEFISHRVNGLIIPKKDDQQLQTAMEQLINDHELYHRLKSAARSAISNRYEQSFVWEALFEEYSKQLNLEFSHRLMPAV